MISKPPKPVMTVPTFRIPKFSNCYNRHAKHLVIILLCYTHGRQRQRQQTNTWRRRGKRRLTKYGWNFKLVFGPRVWTSAYILCLKTFHTRLKQRCLPRPVRADTAQNTNAATELYKTEAKFKHLGKTLVNQNSMHEEINGTLISENPCSDSFLTRLSSRLLIH